MEEMNRKADAVFMTETLFDGQTEQGVELAEQWLDALRRRQRLDELLVKLLEDGLANIRRT